MEPPPFLLAPDFLSSLMMTHSQEQNFDHKHHLLQFHCSPQNLDLLIEHTWVSFPLSASASLLFLSSLKILLNSKYYIFSKSDGLLIGSVDRFLQLLKECDKTSIVNPSSSLQIHYSMLMHQIQKMKNLSL